MTKKAGSAKGGKKIDWEKSVARLEEIVRTLEGGGTGLDESLDLFEEGTRLVKELEKALAQAELRVRKLLDDGKKITEEPFQGEEE